MRGCYDGTDPEIRAVVEKKMGAGEADGECLAGYCVYQSYYEAFVWVSRIIEDNIRIVTQHDEIGLTG